MNEHFFLYNGVFFREDRSVIGPGHPAFAFGDCLFETMRVHDGVIINSDLHFARLKNGMETVGYEYGAGFFQDVFNEIVSLISKNHHGSNVRVRLSVCRSSNAFARKENGVDYLVETKEIGEPVFNAEGIHASIYSESLKGTGTLSNLKHSNYLLNILAYRSAVANGAQEGILLNAYHRICETSIANICFIEEGKIYTPSLAEGCVDGTVRRWLMKSLPGFQMHIFETSSTIERLLDADEVFATNAIQWVRPVTAIGNKTFAIKTSRYIFQAMEESLI